MRHRLRVSLLALCTLMMVLALSGVAMAVGSIEGTITDAATGEPLAGINVRVYFDDLNLENQQEPRASVVTTTDGSFSIPDLDAGYYNIVYSDHNDIYRDMSFPGWGGPVKYAYAWPVQDDKTFDASIGMYKIAAVNANRTSRIQGSNPYSAAINASKMAFGSASTVVVAGGAGWPDALSASTLAGYYGSPVLLTPASGVPSGFVAEVRRLGAKRAVIVGGTRIVSDRVVRQLRTRGISVTRIAGSDRYATSAAIVRYLLNRDAPVEKNPFVVSGETWADAVTVAPFAYQELRPVLLVKPTSAPASTISVAKALKMDYAVVVGGTRVVSDRALRSLAAAGSYDAYRWSGDNRYDTAATLARAYPAYDYIAIANGYTFHEALIGGVTAGSLRGTLLLTPGGSLYSGAKSIISRHKLYLWSVDAFGRRDQVSARALSQARSAIGNGVYDIDGEIQTTAATSVSGGRGFDEAVKHMKGEHFAR